MGYDRSMKKIVFFRSREHHVGGAIESNTWPKGNVSLAERLFPAGPWPTRHGGRGRAGVLLLGQRGGGGTMGPKVGQI